MHLLDFPNEIQEVILSYLDISNLIAAARTCTRWKAVVNNTLLKKWCLANVTSDLFREMTTRHDHQIGNSNEDTGGVDWQDLCERWSQTVATHLLPTGEQLPAAEGAPVQFEVRLSAKTVSTFCVTMAVSGDCVIVGDQSDQLIWYDRDCVEVAKRCNHGQPVAGMALVDIGQHCHRQKIDTSNCRLNLEHDAIIVLSSEFLAIYAMPEMNCREMHFSSERPGSRLVSVDGRRFAHADRSGKCVTVSRIGTGEVSRDVTGNQIPIGHLPLEVKVEVLHRFQSDHHIHNWKLWRDCLICLLQNGTVVTFDLVTNITTHSVSVSDFLYPFESFLHRGLIFCNISTARTLLNYWHVNMGLPHWLVSADDGAHFKRVRTYFSFQDEITTVCIHGTIMVAGTRGGRICFYCYKGDDRQLPNMSLERPILICKLTNGPIYRIDFGTRDEKLLVCVKTIQNTALAVILPLAQNFDAQG